MVSLEKTNTLPCIVADSSIVRVLAKMKISPSISPLMVTLEPKANILPLIASATVMSCPPR